MFHSSDPDCQYDAASGTYTFNKRVHGRIAGYRLVKVHYNQTRIDIGNFNDTITAQVTNPAAQPVFNIQVPHGSYYSIADLVDAVNNAIHTTAVAGVGGATVNMALTVKAFPATGSDIFLAFIGDNTIAATQTVTITQTSSFIQRVMRPTSFVTTITCNINSFLTSFSGLMGTPGVVYFGDGWLNVHCDPLGYQTRSLFQPTSVIGCVPNNFISHAQNLLMSQEHVNEDQEMVMCRNILQDVSVWKFWFSPGDEDNTRTPLHETYPWRIELVLFAALD